MAAAGVVDRGGGGLRHLRLPRLPFSSPSSTATGSPNPSRREMPVCKFWMQGRCNRHPCPFLHSGEGVLPPGQHQLSRAAPPQRHHQHREETQQQQGCRRSAPGSLVWRRGSCPAPASAAARPESRSAERLTSPTRPPRCVVGEIEKGATIVGLGEDAVDLDCSPPPGDGDVVKNGISIGPGEVVDPLCLPPPPPPPPRVDEDAETMSTAAMKLGEKNALSFSLVTSLGGHQQPVTGIALPSGSDKMFTGSADGTLRVWDCGSGQCLQVVDLGGPLSCVVTDGHWVFAGGHGGVRGCNTVTGAGLTLPGTTGEVCSLGTSTDVVFAGMADGSILAWKVAIDDTAGGAGLCFLPAASLDGHTSAVASLVVGCSRTRLCSGSADRTIRVWDVQTLQCIHTVFSAHDDVVASVLFWDSFLLSGSLDGSIKVWAAAAKDEGVVDSCGDGGGGLREVYAKRHQEGQGVLLLNGVYDAEGRVNVLMCSLGDSTVRLYDLPSFSERGSIAAGGEVRAMHSGPQGSGLFFTGDAAGDVGVWRCGN